MPKYRKDKIDKCLNYKDKLLSLGAGILLYKELKDVNIVFNEYNKPYLENNSIYFNISHSGNMVVCAFSDLEIGVDIEKIKSFNKVKNLVFTKEEIEYLNNDNLLYTKLWTIKESFIKYLGIPYDLKKVNIDLINNKINYLNKELYFNTYIIDNYVFTICSEYKLR